LTTNAPQSESYWQIVWRQYRGSSTNLIALYTIIALVMVAVYSPAFSSRIPFIWSAGDGVSFPWFSTLLFNRNVYSSAIDLFFNTCIYAIPVGYLLVRLMAAKTDWSARRIAAIIALLFVAFYIFLLVYDPKAAVPAYRRLALSGEDVFAVFPPLRMNYSDVVIGQDGPGMVHLLGLDTAGRDIFVRMLYGTRISMSVGVVAVGIYITIGVFLGSIAGYFGGRADMIILRLIEIVICFPAFFLILTFISFLEHPSVLWIMVFIGVVGWTGPARLVRGEFLRLKGMEYVTAARALGAPDRRVIFRHVLPNALGPVLVNATFGIAAAVLTESSLSFLGIGDRTAPSWGRVLALGRSIGSDQMMLIAGFAIFLTVSAFNLAGEGLRDALDPKLKK
jgi:peptide/nickel transport system permease protein